MPVLWAQVARAPCSVPRRRAILEPPRRYVDSEASHAKGQSWPMHDGRGSGSPPFYRGAWHMQERRGTRVTIPWLRFHDGSCSWVVPVKPVIGATVPGHYAALPGGHPRATT